MWTAAILAGGQARRLGGLDKSALAVGAAGGAPTSILERQLAVLRGLTPHILIVAREDSPARTVTVPVVCDRVAGAGALGGLYTALMDAPTEQVVVIACDMPFVTAPFLAHVAALGADPAVDAVVPRDARGQHPLCASYRRRAAAALKRRIDLHQLRVLDALSDLTVRDLGPAELAPFDPDDRLLLNVNTPEDYTRAQQI
jgi:molybdopterin-guanine dinucleotide biosynthesis protein A